MTLKKLIPIGVLAFAICLTSCKDNTPIVQKPYNDGINITPTPLELTKNEGNFKLNNKTAFWINDSAVEKIIALFSAKIKNSTGYNIYTIVDKPTSNFISLNITSEVPVNDEGYVLEVTSNSIDIKAKTAKGIFYGMQTIMQLLPAEIESPTLVNGIAWEIPNVNIKDEPRFPYRGQHLDVCRHFANVDYIKKQLDVLAMFKINKFHWHLTEDQGWRIEIKKYPKLTEIGSKRVEGDGTVYGPFFYTQDQIKEVVAYAKERFIDVIPEIELPGHGVSALAAYPEFSCTGGPFEVRNIWGVANDVYCAGNDSTFQFLTDVIEEVIPLFESEYFHIGGDECPKDRWKNCPKCQARIKELGLKSDKNHSAEEKLQSYFVQRMEKVLLKHNKKMIGWDEILEGGLAPTATVMSWRGEEGGIAAANMGHDVIMTPGDWLYLDRYQEDSNIEPVSIGGFAPLEKTYSYEPVPEKIAEDKKAHILGAQANVWAEYMYTPDLMEYMTYPRILALAELNWSAKEKKNYKDFERRLNNQLVRLDMHKINYFIPKAEQVTPSCNFVAFTDSANLAFKTVMPIKVVYTTDGSEPSINSAVYEKPLIFKENTTLKIRTVLMSDKLGAVRTITIEKQTPAQAQDSEKGKDEKYKLEAEHYKGVTLNASDLDGRTPDEIEYISAPQNAQHRILGYKEIGNDDFYSTVISGYIDILEDGVYYFSTNNEFWLDGKLFITNAQDIKTARRFSRADKSIALAKGLHSMKLVRLGAIFGGWPMQWEPALLSIRPEKEEKFRLLDEKDFK